jgi:hypothetical protein
MQEDLISIIFKIKENVQLKHVTTRLQTCINLPSMKEQTNYNISHGLERDFFTRVL